jgi:hypothetical protein
MMPTQELKSDRAVTALPVPQVGQIDYWDALLPAFGVRVGHGGRKSFIVATRVNGKFRRFTLKPAFPELTLSDARARAVQIIADARNGITPKVREYRTARDTFGAVTEAFMTDYARHHRTRREYSAADQCRLSCMARHPDRKHHPRRHQGADPSQI